METIEAKKAKKAAADKLYREVNKEKISARRKQYREKNKEKIKESQYACYAKNKEKYNARVKAWKAENPDKVSEHAKRQREKDIDASRKNGREKTKKYSDSRRTDPAWLLRRRMSSRMLRSLKSVGIGRKPRGWEQLVGYSLSQLKSHIESLFCEGMSWENIGKWHIDHIIPVSSFEIQSADCPGFKECWSLENLRPLWAIDNLKKHAKII